MSLSPKPRHRSAWLHAWLALLLLSAQGLGLLHRAAHAPALAPVAWSVDHAHRHDSAHAANTPFGHAADETGECRLFDQLALADLLSGDSPTLQAIAPACRAAEAAVSSLRPARTAGYQARAPPTTA